MFTSRSQGSTVVVIKKFFNFVTVSARSSPGSPMLESENIVDSEPAKKRYD
jgi:hypothetical protein